MYRLTALLFSLLLVSTALSAEPLADADLELEVRAALLHEIGSSAIDVRVSAEGDQVILRGTVPNRETSARVAQVAEATPRVATVDNRLDVTGKRSSAASVRDALLATEVKRMLLDELGTDALDIRVELQGRLAHLRGVVDNPRHRAIALFNAARFDEIEKVVDELELKRS